MILLIGVSYLLYMQLTKVELSSWKNLKLNNPLFAIFSFLLVSLNWFLEWLKWKLTLETIKTNTSHQVNFRAFMAGIATGLITPNMLGNFIGRIYYFKRKLRPSIILLTLVSNFAQFLASLIFGILSILFLRETPLGIELALIVLVLFPLILFFIAAYFHFEKVKWPLFKSRNWYIRLVKLIKEHKQLRFQFFILSITRHFVFTLQFWLLFNAFEDAINLDTFFWIWQIFLWTTIIPSLWFGKLVIRESIALLVLGSIGFGQVEILTTSILIWIINLALPSLISIFICRKKQSELE